MEMLDINTIIQTFQVLPSVAKNMDFSTIENFIYNGTILRLRCYMQGISNWEERYKLFLDASEAVPDTTDIHRAEITAILFTLYVLEL